MFRRGIFVSVLACGLLLIAIVLLMHDSSAASSIEPQFQKATLEVEGLGLKALRVVSPWRPEYLVGQYRLILHQDSVDALDVKTGKRLWSANSHDGRDLRWLTTDGAVGFLRTNRPESKKSESRYESPAAVRRLDLSAGKWLTSLVAGLGEKKPAKQAETIASVLADEHGIVVLSMTLLDDERSHEDGQISSYRISYFAPGKDKPIWSKSFASAGERPYTGGFLLAPSRPDYAVSSIQHLSWLDNSILVCAGERQDLICLARPSGGEVWRVPRVWEFERGFTGPSVWAHHLGRFGLIDFKATEEKLGPARKRFEKHFDCSIIAGPVVLPYQPDRVGAAQYSIFVAVAKGPKAGWSGYLSDCIVYELNQRGEPIGLAQVPRMINGWQLARLADGVVWACQRGAFLKLGLSENRQSQGEMLGGHDMICHVDWYRQLAYRRPKAWLVADKAGDVVAFTSTHAVAVSEGGYVLKNGEPVYRFPISLIDLKTGLDRTVTVAVPFNGQLPEPTTNYSGSEEGGFHTRGPYLLGITGLKIEGQELRITLGMEGSATGVDFDFGQLLNRVTRP